MIRGDSPATAGIRRLLRARTREYAGHKRVCYQCSAARQIGTGMCDQGYGLWKGVAVARAQLNRSVQSDIGRPGQETLF